MKMYRWKFVIVLCWVSLELSAQNTLPDNLVSLGFENVSSGMTDDGNWIRFEDRINRNTYQGIIEAVNLILESTGEVSTIDLIVDRNRIPQLKVHLPRKLLAAYREGKVSAGEVFRQLEISRDTDNYRKGRKPGRVKNSSAGKIDLVFYPQIGLANYRMDKLYVVDISLTPALEMQLWPGAKFTGQVVFPLYNNLKGEVDYIRPGVLALSQYFRLNDHVFGEVSVGNFTDDRMGAAVGLGYCSPGGYWGISLNGGITGSSSFYGGKWEVSNWKRLNCMLSTFFYIPACNLEFDVSAGQYVYGDKGGRVDCIRRFGEVAVGLYAMYSGKEANGGFNFSIPLPGRKRMRSRRFPVRVMLPEYFDWEYEAQSGPDYKQRRLGRTYKTHPDTRHGANDYNPFYIKSNIMNYGK